MFQSISPENRLKIYKAVRRLLVKESKATKPDKGFNGDLFTYGLCYNLRDLAAPFVGHILQMYTLPYFPEVDDQKPEDKSSIDYWFPRETIEGVQLRIQVIDKAIKKLSK